MQVLHQLPVSENKDLIVGPKSWDDAGVYRLSPDVALVQSVDFFTPVVDDPYLYGKIAVANSLSDIYAMGAVPLTAQNIAGFPINKLEISVLVEILRGGMDKAKEAGVVIVGGHTIDDEELKYGLSVTGTIHPEKVITNSGAIVGDKIVLTKPLGMGIISTAIKANMVKEETIAKAAEVMERLNRVAAESMKEVGVNACTDVSGFGLLGHLYEMLYASNLSAVVYADKVDYLNESFELAAEGLIPAGSHANRGYLFEKVKIGKSISRNLEMILYDAQTSGGLLISVAGNKLDELLKALESRKVGNIQVIGEMIKGERGMIEVI
jgi:selenide,water dikinase